jgi:MFS family permease
VSEKPCGGGTGTPTGVAARFAPQGKPSRLWRQPGFTKLWAGQSVSLLGSSVTTLALPLTAIYTLHADAAQIGVIKTLQWLPWILVSLWAGVWSDRHRRRPAMIAADLGQAFVLCTIVALAAAQLLSLPVMFAAVFCLGTLTVFFTLSYSAYVPFIVGRDLLVPANSRLQASASFAAIAGPSLGALLVEVLTAPVALVADIASWLVSAASLLWIRKTEPTTHPPGKTSVRAEIGAGLSVVFSNPLLRALMGTSGFFNLFIQWMNTLFILFMVRDLGLHAGAIGLMVSCQSTGALAGSFLSSPLSRRFGIGRAFMAAVVCECLVMTVAPLAPAGHHLFATLLIGAMLFVNGLGSTVSGIIGTSVRQAVTPQNLIGRMTAAFQFVGYGVVALGALFGGLAGQALGLRQGLLIGAIGIQGTIIWMALSALPRVRELPVASSSEDQPASDVTAGDGTTPGTSQAGRLRPARASPGAAGTQD